MDIVNHTKRVMENVKHLVEGGGGTMDSILQLTVYLAKIDDYDGMNKVFKTYLQPGEEKVIAEHLVQLFRAHSA